MEDKKKLEQLADEALDGVSGGAKLAHGCTRPRPRTARPTASPATRSSSAASRPDPDGSITEREPPGLLTGRLSVCQRSFFDRLKAEYFLAAEPS